MNLTQHLQACNVNSMKNACLCIARMTRVSNYNLHTKKMHVVLLFICLKAKSCRGIFSLHKIAVIWISCVFFFISLNCFMLTEIYKYQVNVCFWKCIQMKITGFRPIVLSTSIIFSGKMFYCSSLHKSLKFYLYELMWKIF